MLAVSLFFTWRRMRSYWLDSLLLVLALAFAVSMLILLLCLSQKERLKLGGMLLSPQYRSIELIKTTDDYSKFKTKDGIQALVRLPDDDREFEFNAKDLEVIRREAPSVKYAYIEGYSGSFDEKTREHISMKSITPDYLKTIDYEMVGGFMPSMADFKQKRKVIALSEYSAKKHFKKKNPLGQMFFKYKVIGIFKIDESQNMYIHDEFETSRSEYGAKGVIPFGTGEYDFVASLKFMAAPGESDQAREQLRAAATKRWGERASLREAVTSIKETYQQLLKTTFAQSLLGVGGLLVASLCLLGLLLSRVLSRQRQLAIASSLGATKLALGTQMLGEAALLGFLGGLLGVAGGWALVRVLNKPFKPTEYNFIQFAPSTVALVLVGSVLLVLLFSLIPAWHASRVRPAEVLRG